MPLIVKNILKSLIPNVGRNNENCRKTWLESTLLKIPNNCRILDAGAGAQQHRKYCKHLEYISQDFCEYDGKGDSTALQTGEFNYGNVNIVSDITSIPEPDSSFDAIMCIEVLERVPDPIQAIKELSRLLKPNGQFIVTAPFCSVTHFSPYHFSSGFNKYWYKSHLIQCGFNEIEISPNGNFFEYLAQEIYRIPSTSSRYLLGLA